MRGAVTAVRAEISERMARLQAAYDDRDRLLAHALRVGRTDLRCLDLLIRDGAQSPSGLAARLGLTRGSVTTMVGRLAAKGYVTQTADSEGGHRKVVQASDDVARRVHEAYRGHLARAAVYLDDFTQDDLNVVLRFLDATLALQDEARADLQALNQPHG